MRHCCAFFSENAGFRNHYCTENDNPIWCDLQSAGYAEGFESGGQFYFRLTEKGENLIGLPGQKRLLRSIKKRHQDSFENFCKEYEIEIQEGRLIWVG